MVLYFELLHNIFNLHAFESGKGFLVLLFCSVIFLMNLVFTSLSSIWSIVSINNNLINSQHIELT